MISPKDMTVTHLPANNRRDELFDIAAEIFWSKGYHATSMNNLAEAMNMRKATLYHYIDSKETLLYEISMSSMTHILEAAVATVNLDPEKRLKEIIVRHITTLLEERSRHATALIELRSLLPTQRAEIIKLRDQYDALIDAAIFDVQQTTWRWSGVRTQFVRFALLGMLNWAVFWFSGKGSETPASIAESFCAILMPNSAG